MSKLFEKKKNSSRRKNLSQKKSRAEKSCAFLHKNNKMLKRRRGQNASINPALEHIEVDADILRASLTCELCKNILREANTVVCFLY